MPVGLSCLGSNDNVNDDHDNDKDLVNGYHNWKLKRDFNIYIGEKKS